ncbi:hypothetical protein Lal_00039241 [Lupinus albus]|nr:hypothetical protein Lal_00039241 [Lupinus albus]
MVGMRKDPKVGSGVGGTYEVTKNQTQRSPSNTPARVYVACFLFKRNENLLLANLKGCIDFDSSYAAKKMNFKMNLGPYKSKIDEEVVHKMGFSIDPVDRCTYKHRTDRLTPPTAQAEPTIPNPREFQAHSSSSAAMPSNQMIMDELVSLRGYITTRMDALDTQNQQIHYELHRLSSRLNSMDVDEDSSDQKGEKVGRNAYNSKRKWEHTQDKSRNIIKYAALRKLHLQEDIGLSSSKMGRL